MNHIMKNLIYLFAITIGLTSCSGNGGFFDFMKPKSERLSLQERLNAAEITGYSISKDLQYGENSFQAYDLYSPVVEGEATPSVAMIVIHGGGWSLLDKSFMNGQVQEFLKLKKNVSIFNINHRLAGVDGTTYEDIIADIDLMVREIETKREELNLAKEIIFYGYSSGGHLALDYVKQNNRNNNIAVVGAAAPPTDLTSMEIRQNIIDDKNRNLTELLIGQPFDENPQAYRDASPIFKVAPSNKPTILFYGSNDQIITDDQVQTLSKLLSDKKVKNRLVTFDGTSHDMGPRQQDIATEYFMFVEER